MGEKREQGKSPLPFLPIPYPCLLTEITELARISRYQFRAKKNGIQAYPLGKHLSVLLDRGHFSPVLFNDFVN